jgi:hypothetical protein
MHYTYSTAMVTTTALKEYKLYGSSMSIVALSLPVLTPPPLFPPPPPLPFCAKIVVLQNESVRLQVVI